jgi:hypothetical protein
MPVQVRSRVNYLLNVPGPIEVLFEPRQTIVFPYIEYDSVINDERIQELIYDERIEVLSLEPGNPPLYNSEWFGPVKFRLGSYQIWVDSLGKLRIKFGDAISDFDGSEVGAGAVGPHGNTHVFNGPDPVPNIEVLENPWNCTAGESVLDVVYQSASSTVRQANATSTLTMPAVGIIIAKPTATTCIIARSGEVPGFGSLTADRAYYVDTTNGAITSTPPNAGNNVVQVVGYAKTNDILVVELGASTKKAP